MARPVAVIALGGNALLPRGERPEAGRQLRAARAAARRLAQALDGHRLVVTHGNGPQVGLLALKDEAYDAVPPYPLDMLDAETEGQLGYLIEMEIDNATTDYDTVALVTRVVVDPGDPAFDDPGKFIGPVYTEPEARELAERKGWTVRPDGDGWRRVVPSPEPRNIVQLPAIRELVDSGFVVVCAGGGGIPVVPRGDTHHGIEAVIDKDLTSARLAVELGADVLVLATDVDAVYLDWGSPKQTPIGSTTPSALREHVFERGSMAEKVEAGCRMVEQTGGTAAIGSLDSLDGLLTGECGTRIGGGSPVARSGNGRAP